MPFASIATGERGTYFIGYARTPAVIEQMLTNMFIGNPPGNDRPDPRVLHRCHRGTVLRPSRRIPRRSAGGPGAGGAPSVGAGDAEGTAQVDGADGLMVPDGTQDQSLRIGSLNTRTGATSS